MASLTLTLTVKQRECLAWLRTNVVECRGVELSPQQLQQLSAVVGDDAVCALRVAMGCRVAVTLAGLAGMVVVVVRPWRTRRWWQRR
jgi:hypothetical protein